MRILGHLAERHFVAILAALERLDEDAAELRQLRETLDALESRWQYVRPSNDRRAR